MVDIHCKDVRKSITSFINRLDIDHRKIFSNYIKKESLFICDPRLTTHPNFAKGCVVYKNLFIRILMKNGEIHIENINSLNHVYKILEKFIAMKYLFEEYAARDFKMEIREMYDFYMKKLSDDMIACDDFFNMNNCDSNMENIGQYIFFIIYCKNIYVFYFQQNMRSCHISKINQFPTVLTRFYLIFSKRWKLTITYRV